MTTWELASEEEIKANRENGEYDSAPITADDYVVKIMKVTLEKLPKWNESLRKFDHSTLYLAYKLICSAYKPKAEDAITDVKGREVKPLTGWIWREVNPFSIGFTQTNEPTFMRALLAYVQGQSGNVKDKINIPAVIILNKNDEVATEEEAAEYKKQFSEIQQGLRTPDEFAMAKVGFKHIPDIRVLEGKYVGAKITEDSKGRNKITAFSKVPSSFAPDATIEKEAVEKFAESYKKMQERREEKNKVAEVNSANENAPSNELPPVDY